MTKVLAGIRLVQIEKLTKAIDGQKKVGSKNILMRKKGEIEFTNLTALPIFTSYSNKIGDRNKWQDDRKVRIKDSLNIDELQKFVELT